MSASLNDHVIDVIMDEHDRGEVKRLYFLIVRDMSYKVKKIGGIIRNQWRHNIA